MSEHTGYIKGKGLLVVISGFSGAGKGSITKQLIKNYGYAYSVSATTRNPREGEKDGVDYFFISKERFEEMIDKGELLEYNNYVGNYYGTPREYVLEQMKEGRDVILEIDVNGAAQVKKSYPEAVTVFITAPNASELKDRLTGRGTEAEDVVRKRLQTSIKETESIKDYDFMMINDDLDLTVKHMDSLIRDQHMRTAGQDAYIEKFKKEMTELLSGI